MRQVGFILQRTVSAAAVGGLALQTFLLSALPHTVRAQPFTYNGFPVTGDIRNYVFVPTSPSIVLDTPAQLQRFYRFSLLGGYPYRISTGNPFTYNTNPSGVLWYPLQVVDAANFTSGIGNNFDWWGSFYRDTTGNVRMVIAQAPRSPVNQAASALMGQNVQGHAQVRGPQDLQLAEQGDPLFPQPRPGGTNIETIGFREQTGSSSRRPEQVLSQSQRPSNNQFVPPSTQQETQRVTEQQAQQGQTTQLPNVSQVHCIQRPSPQQIEDHVYARETPAHKIQYHNRVEGGQHYPPLPENKESPEKSIEHLKKEFLEEVNDERKKNNQPLANTVKFYGEDPECQGVPGHTNVAPEGQPPRPAGGPPQGSPPAARPPTAVQPPVPPTLPIAPVPPSIPPSNPIDQLLPLLLAQMLGQLSQGGQQGGGTPAGGSGGGTPVGSGAPSGGSVVPPGPGAFFPPSSGALPPSPFDPLFHDLAQSGIPSSLLESVIRFIVALIVSFLSGTLSVGETVVGG